MASGSQRISARTRNFIPPAQADTVETKESCPTRANTGADTRRIVGFVVPDKPATMKFKFRGDPKEDFEIDHEDMLLHRLGRRKLVPKAPSNRAHGSKSAALPTKRTKAPILKPVTSNFDDSDNDEDIAKDLLLCRPGRLKLPTKDPSNRTQGSKAMAFARASGMKTHIHPIFDSDESDNSDLEMSADLQLHRPGGSKLVTKAPSNMLSFGYFSRSIMAPIPNPALTDFVDPDNAVVEFGDPFLQHLARRKPVPNAPSNQAHGSKSVVFPRSMNKAPIPKPVTSDDSDYMDLEIGRDDMLFLGPSGRSQLATQAPSNRARGTKSVALPMKRMKAPIPKPATPDSDDSVVEISDDTSSDQVPTGTEFSEEVFSEVVYPADIKRLLTAFPLDKDAITSLRKSVLTGFLDDNNISYNANSSKEILFYRIKEFLDLKHLQRVKERAEKKADATNKSPPEKRMKTSTPKKLVPKRKALAQRQNIQLVTDDMLSELPAESVAQFIKVRSKDRSQVKKILLDFGIELGYHLEKEQLLEKFYRVLVENCQAETGLGISGRKQEEEAAKPKSPKEARKSMIVVNECCVCMENKITTYCYPCGHAALCDGCSKNVSSNCPICRAKIKKVLPVYFT